MEVIINSEIFCKISSTQSTFAPWKHEWVLTTEHSWVGMESETRTGISLPGLQALGPDTH